MNSERNNQIFVIDTSAGLSQPVNLGMSSATSAGNVRRRAKVSRMIWTKSTAWCFARKKRGKQKQASREMKIWVIIKREFLCLAAGDRWRSTPFTQLVKIEKKQPLWRGNSCRKKLPKTRQKPLKRNVRWNCRINLRNQLANNKKVVSTLSADGWRQNVITQTACAKFLV
jgi:hypothetical protein